jgi:hypothetical protein
MIDCEPDKSPAFGGGLVASDEQQEHHRGELVLGEPVLAVADRYQRGEQLVGDLLDAGRELFNAAA